MTRRLVLSNLALISVVLLLLEVPLGLVYARHEHDASIAALQRDASSLGALSEEVIEHPGEHDVAGLARRFSTGGAGTVLIVDRTGARLASEGTAKEDATFRAALLAARAGRPRTGERAGMSYATVILGTTGSSDGAVLLARPDQALDHRVHAFWLLLALIAAAVMVVSTLVSVQLARWAVAPLEKLEDAATALGRGDLDVRADAGRGPSEVVALAATFNEMADRLDTLVQSQRRFVADASHQLRTPLTALRLRLDNLDAEDPEAVSEIREAALVETSRLSRLVDGLLALARAEGPRTQRAVVDVRGALADRFDAWTPLADERRVALRLDADGSGALTALIVPGHLEQVLDNLIDNALEATPAGGTVSLHAGRAGPSVELHVIDTGPGMTPDERARAFDPFWQGTSANRTGTTGLGLAIVEQLVRASGGTITLGSSPSGGVDAVVRLATA